MDRLSKQRLQQVLQPLPLHPPLQQAPHSSSGKSRAEARTCSPVPGQLPFVPRDYNPATEATEKGREEGRDRWANKRQ